MAFKQRVFSGMQATGNPHLGNYLGAITKFVALQDRFECLYCVVDLHAITVWQDPVELPRAIRDVTAAFIASGVDPVTGALRIAVPTADDPDGERRVVVGEIRHVRLARV